MPRQNKKRKAVIADQADPTEPERTEETGPQRVIVRKISATASIMIEETHPWLKWPGCNAARKIPFAQISADEDIEQEEAEEESESENETEDDEEEDQE